MPDPNAVPHAEMQLEVLLRQFLGEDMDDLEPQASGEVPPAVSELADLARRLNAAARDAALASLGGACGARANVIPARRRRPLRPRGRRLQAYPWEWATAAAAVAVGVVGFGLGMMWAGASPSSPWYRARLAVEDIQVALAPSPLARAELLVRNARAHHRNPDHGVRRKHRGPAPGCRRARRRRGVVARRAAGADGPRATRARQGPERRLADRGSAVAWHGVPHPSWRSARSRPQRRFLVGRP